MTYAHILAGSGIPRVGVVGVFQTNYEDFIFTMSQDFDPIKSFQFNYYNSTDVPDIHKILWIATLWRDFNSALWIVFNYIPEYVFSSKLQDAEIVIHYTLKSDIRVDMQFSVAITNPNVGSLTKSSGLFMKIDCEFCKCWVATLVYSIYCDVPGWPRLSKNGSNVRGVSFSNFSRSTCERTKGSLTLCLVAARSPGWFVGDPTSLARDNIYINLLLYVCWG